MKKIVDYISKVNYIFTKQQKIKLIFLLLFFIVTAFFELLGVAAVMPLIDVMMNEEAIQKTWYLKAVYDGMGFTGTKEFIIALSAFLIFVYIVKNVLTSIMYKAQYSFTFSTQHDLAKKIMNCYMRQPYSFHVSHSSSEMIRSVETDIPAMFQGILSVLQLIAELLVCLVLGVYLVIKDKSIAIAVVAFMAIYVMVVARSFKRRLTKMGIVDRNYALGILKWTQQSFGGMKETKVLCREKYFLDKFDENYTKWADCEKDYRYYQVAPRPIMEAMCITALMLVIILKLLHGTTTNYFVSTVAVFAVAAFRLLPSANRITSFVGVISFNAPFFDAAYKDLKLIENLDLNIDIETKPEIRTLNNSIDIHELSFRYPEGERDIFSNAELTIRKNTSVAFIGPSGAGKTTLADIILGVLLPTSGKILIDGEDMYSNLRGWQQNIGYIPQTIYLMDDTIENNILYGAADVDENKLSNAIKQAQLDQFINSLNDGIKTVIGEGGVRLSGGQRQRIGIARALYNNPDVLVLDEATSALDNDTETAVMEAIESLAGHKTLIIIAHRLTTIRNCDVVYEVRDGKVTQVNNPNEG